MYQSGTFKASNTHERKNCIEPMLNEQVSEICACMQKHLQSSSREFSNLGTSPIKIVMCKFFATLVFKHCEWLKMFSQFIGEI